MKTKTKRNKNWTKQVERELKALDDGPPCAKENDSTENTLSLRYLKLQVDAALSAHESGAHEFRRCGPDWNPETGLLWIIGDFEIRRRK